MTAIDIYAPENRWCENITLEDDVCWELDGFMLTRRVSCGGGWTHHQTFELSPAERDAWLAAFAAASK